jgi:putative endonuclease
VQQAVIVAASPTVSLPAKAGNLVLPGREMSVDRSYWVYILASKLGGTLYIGVTNDLVRRVYIHRSDAVPGFTQKYHVHRLVYFEQFSEIEHAIRREKRLKKWPRAWKVQLIERSNPNWDDLYPVIARP